MGEKGFGLMHVRMPWCEGQCACPHPIHTLQHLTGMFHDASSLALQVSCTHLYADVRDPIACMQASLLAEVKTVLDLPKEDESKDDKVKALRQDINTWVAAYRREPKVSGRPSYGCVTCNLSSRSGHECLQCMRLASVDGKVSGMQAGMGNAFELLHPHDVPVHHITSYE